jgi:uncharacterized protein (DUF1800 family)
MRANLAGALLVLLMVGSAPLRAQPAPQIAITPSALGTLDRLTWGAQTRDAEALQDQGLTAWLDQQLHPSADDGLPKVVADQIAAMEISQKPLTQINSEIRALQQAAQQVKGTPDFDAAQKAYQQKLNDLAREAQTRSLLRDLYSKNQLKEQLTWFWMNHFNVFQSKGEIRAFVGDYEETIRDHALGKFKDLLFATMIHPAMLQYLDNAQNAVGHINENYARELMELHTLGVGSGYTQTDVQQLARILTGLGVNLTGNVPNLRPELTTRYRAKGLFEFNPVRHEFGDKTFLHGIIEGEGMEEAAKAAVYLSEEPPTAMHISRQLAEYFCCDSPDDALVRNMARTFALTHGDIAQVMNTLLSSRQFKDSLDRKFKDPLHFVVSAVRAAYNDQPIVNPTPLFNWLNRMGEPFYGHETPDGYPIDAASWSAPGQMETRFEFAQQLGRGGLPFYQPQLASPVVGEPPAPAPKPVLPIALQISYYQMVAPGLSHATLNALNQGTTAVDKNMLLLSSPEFMHR